MTFEALKEEVKKRIRLDEGADVMENDSEIMEFLLDNCEIVIPQENRFFVKVNCEELGYSVIGKRAKKFKTLIRDAGLSEGEEALAYLGVYDVSHTSAEWESVISLGIFGLRERVARYAREKENDKKAQDFYKCILRCYDGALRFIKRASDAARACGKYEMSDGLLHLTQGAPRDLFEALQTSILYYTLQICFDGTYLRTLGRIDKLFYPYFAKEERGRAEDLILDYIKEIDKLDAPANVPFAICGTDVDQNDLTNELSYALIDSYEKAETTNTKIHFLCSKKTPQSMVERAFRSISRGNNSIVFLSDERVIESLINQGAEYADAVNYHVVGCYECGADGELTYSCNGRVNIQKALELALNGGVDMLTGKQIGLERKATIECYDDLCLEFERQLRYLCDCAVRSTDLWEEHYHEMHSSPIMSGTYTRALETGRDLYRDYGAKYNSSSINAIGLATATDSLAAIRKAVYEDKLMTLNELVDILKSNWSGKEHLRLTVKHRYPKFGQGDKRTDDIAKWIVDVLSDSISGRPNVKGGKYRLGLFSINWRWSIGGKTAASADGRLSGETLSQNTGASFGADKEGVTAHLISVARLDTSKTPNGAIVDIDLHSSAVRGENGIKALAATLRTYFEQGGFGVHYNVLDTAILTDAKSHPEKYPTLQVRLCGWNVLFSSLSEREKDEFIARSMR